MGHVPPYGVIKISQNCLYLLSRDEHTAYIFEAYLFLKHYIYWQYFENQYLPSILVITIIIKQKICLQNLHVKESLKNSLILGPGCI